MALTRNEKRKEKEKMKMKMRKMENKYWRAKFFSFFFLVPSVNISNWIR